MRKNRLGVVLPAGMAIAFPFVCAPLAFAQADTPVKALGTVTVNSGQPTSLPTQIPTTIEGITREQLERTVNATDSEDALKYLPSLLVRKRYIGDYNHAVLSTRASGTGNSARSMVYADGILLSNYLGNGATFAPRWGLVTPEEIERVDVLYGPFSAAYPGNSVGAVVDYVTRMPTKFEAHGKISYSRQNFDLYNTHDSFSGKQVSASAGNRSGDFSWFFNASRTDSGGQPLVFATRTVASGAVNTTGTAVTGAVQDLNRNNQPWFILGTTTAYDTVQDHYKVKLAYDLTPTVRASYTLGYWENTSKGRPDSYLRDAGGNPVFSGPVNVNGRSYTLAATDFNQSNEDIAHVMHGLSVKSRTLGEWDWEIAASQYDYHRDTLRAPTVALPTAASGGAGRIVDQSGTGWNTFAAKGIWRPNGVKGAHLVDFGYQRDAYQLRSTENNTADWLNGAPTTRRQGFRGNTELNSLYAQDAWTFAPAWKTVLGLRAEHWEARDGETANATSVAPHARRSDNALSPKAALAWQVSPEWVLKTSYGRAVRFPTVSELYQGGLNANGSLVNNDPNLKPEKSNTSELSAERDLGYGLWRVTAFFERTHDALYSQINRRDNQTVSTVQNVDAIRTHGIETAFQGADVFWRGLDLGGSVTWTDSTITRNAKNPLSVGKEQPRVPNWRATAVATWRPDANWSYTFAARYSGRQFSTLENDDPNGFAYMGASKYFTTDVRVRWQVSKQWSAAFGIDNLNNYKYWNFHPYPQRTYTAELKFDL